MKTEEEKTDLELRLEREDRERFAFSQLTEPEKNRIQFESYVRYKSDPWAFLRDCVWTLDQVSLDQDAMKPFPSHFAYLEFLTVLWQRFKLMAIPKSRRMTCSWNFISLYTHDTLFHKGRFNAFVSKKEDDARDLVQRAEFITTSIPEWRIPKQLLPKIKNGKMKNSPPILEFEEIHSKIQGFPQGASQLRQFTLSGILGDECAFWEEAEDFYSASKPTLDGGGRMTLISSRSPGFFKKLVFDKLDQKDYNFPEIPPVTPKVPLEGVKLYQNPKNKFLVVDLKYTANPAKRSAEWKQAVRDSMPLHQFMMEYEDSWQAYSGMPVYPDFRRGFHSTQEHIPLEPGVPLLLGVDFGLTPAFVLCQLVGSQLRIVREFLETNGSIKKLAPEVWSWLKLHAKDWANRQEEMIYLFIDPAGIRRSEADENTCHAELRRAGFRNVRSGPVAWEERRGAVENYLLRVTKEGPGLFISEAGCPITFEGFNGAYRYPDKTAEIEPGKARPIKNNWSHPHDAVQYVAWGATFTRKQHTSYIPEPYYRFNEGR